MKSREKFLAVPDWRDSVARMIQSGFLSEEDRKTRGVKMGRPTKLAEHQRREATKRRDSGNETLAEIGRSYNVSR
jgi:hypothetical protein